MQSLVLYLLLTLFGISISGCETTGLIGVQRSLSNTPWGYEKVSSPEPIYLGKRSQRFEVRPGDCGEDLHWSDCKFDRERSEVTAQNAIFYPGSDRWISFMIFFPNDFETSKSVSTTLAQIHMKGGFEGSAGGFKSFPPLLQLGAQGPEYFACFHVLTGDERHIMDQCEFARIANISDLKGKWNRLTLHLEAKPKRPTVQIFLNGKLTASFTQSLSRDPQHYFFVYGIYRSFVSRHGDKMPTQVVYYDELKVGASREVVEDEKVVID